jgi:translation initiation factor 2 beta subunit (eIF-2beta)/eIF-5
MITVAELEYAYTQAQKDLDKLVNSSFTEPDPGNFVEGKQAEWEYRKIEFENNKKKQIVFYETRLRSAKDAVQAAKAQYEKTLLSKAVVLEEVKKQVDRYNEIFERLETQYQVITNLINRNLAIFSACESQGIRHIPKGDERSLPRQLELVSHVDYADRIILKRNPEE